MNINILTLENITKSYGERKLLDGADFYLQEGEKVGIIGINGTGKSTLLKIIAGLETPDSGSRVQASHVILRMLDQQPVFDPGATVLEAALKDCRSASNEWTIEADAKQMLNEWELSDFSQKVDELSGGQRKRLALIHTLLLPSDILILDEPTNHLDIQMAQWLESALQKRKGALILVTHDRYFLDSVTKRIVEIDHGKLYSYEAGYSGFLALKAEREDIALAQDRKRRSILRNELKWVQRGAQARTTKQKARLERYEEMKNIHGPEADRSIEMSSVSSRMGRTTVELQDVGMRYNGSWLFRHFTYIFLKKDRIGFVGTNGCGKTTLMKIMEGRLMPEEGEVIRGETIKIGYYSQEIETDPEAGLAYMDPEKRVIDYIRDTAEYVATPEGSVTASQMLDRFLFPPAEQYARIGKLSGGEKRRLNLLRVLMEAPNVLLLDEPTNDLDIQTLTILEDYLDSFDGIVAVVSHDRYFLDRTVRRIFSFEDGKLVPYEGGYTDYYLKRTAREEEEALAGSQPAKKEEKTVKAPQRTATARKLRFSYQEQRDYETIEGEIQSLEEKLSELEEEAQKNAADYSRLSELMEEKEKTQNELDRKMERWMYLEDLAEKIKNQ